MAGAAVKSKLANKDLVNPKKLVSFLDANNPRIFCGTFIGVITGLVQRTDPQDETKVYEGLKGSFIATPSDEILKDGLSTPSRAGILYLTDSMYGIMSSPFKSPEAPADLQVEFGLNVYLEHASNAQGYTWVYDNIIEPETKDPVEELAARITAQQKALPAPEKPAKQGAKKR